MAKPKEATYKSVLKYIELPKNVPKTIKCRLCGETMHWTPINKLTGFWIHKGKSIDVCASKNPLNPGKPVIAQNLHFYQQVKGIWTALTEKHTWTKLEGAKLKGGKIIIETKNKRA